MASGEWIRQQHNLLQAGQTSQTSLAGVGKSWLACALGRKVYSALYLRPRGYGRNCVSPMATAAPNAARKLRVPVRVFLKYGAG